MPSPPRVLILRAAGTNCDEETEFAWNLAGARAERVHVNRLIESPARLRDCQILTIPGGFSYGDDIASGRILAHQLTLALGDAIRDFVERGGLLIGICNGFQVLVKAGFLPGPGLPAATLTYNDSGRFEARWVWLRGEPCNCRWIEPGELLRLPTAHGEGKFVVAPAPDETTAFSALRAAGCVALTYCDAHGALAAYPDNPSGSQFGVAGVCDRTGRVFGLMPHPERCVLPTQRPDWTRIPNPAADGLRVFRRAVESLR